MGVFTLGARRVDGDADSDDGITCAVHPNPRLLLDVFNVGCSFWHRGDRIVRAHAKSYAVELVLEGRGELVCNRRRFDLQPGDVFILHDGERHSYRALDAVWRKHYVTFWPHDERVAAIMRILGLQDVSHLRLGGDAQARCRELFARLDQCARAMQPGARAQLSLLMCELLTLLASTLYDLGSAPRVHPCVARAIAVMHASVSQRVTVTAVAREVGCTPTHLNRLFKQHLGMKTHEWLERFRLRCAARLLRGTSIRLHRIADEVGYSDQYHFSNAFKRNTGMSPSEYRRIVRLDRMHPPSGVRHKL